VAFSPKAALTSGRMAKPAVVLAIIGLLVIPILTIPAMLIAGFGWRAAPRWSRVTLVVGAVLFAAYLLSLHPAAHHG
jgi:hypothetical protein